MKYKSVKPTFYDDFKCSGGDCKYTCCGGWNIFLSKKDYLNGKNQKMSPDMKKIMNDAYKREKKSISDQIYGFIKLDDDGNCKFLNADRLCSLQLECGYTALCTTCKIFPRDRLRIASDIMELALSCGCEEVVKLLMGLKSGVEFANFEDEVNVMDPIQFFVPPNTAKQIYKYYWDLKTMCIAILQSQEYSLDNRMLILGIAIKHVIELEKEDKLAEIPAYADTMMDLVSTQGLNEMLSSLEVDGNAGVVQTLNYIIGATKLRAGTDATNYYLKMFDRIGGTISNSEDGSNEKHVNLNEDLYQQKKAKLNEFLKNYPRFMENVMVNNFHEKALPLGHENDDIWEIYVFFCATYNILKNGLVGCFDDEITVDDVIYTVTYLSRYLFHSEITNKNVVESFKLQEATSLAHMAMLIKG